jgi:hypothetical protein
MVFILFTAIPETENRELYGEGQWALLKKLVTERNPENIGVNISSTHAFSDGFQRRKRKSWKRF